MALKPLFGQHFPFCTFPAIVGVRINGDTATGGEEAGDFYVLGIHQLDEVLHYNVDAVFVEVAVVAEAVQVELEALAFNHLDIGHVAYADLGKIGLAGNGAKGGEFRAVEAYPVIVALVLVLEGFQNFGGVVVLVNDLLAQGLQALVFSVCHTLCGLIFAGFLKALCVLCNYQGVDAVLNVTVHEYGKVVHAPAGTMVRYAGLGVVVCANLSGAVSGGYHCLAFCSDAVKVLLVLHVVQTCTELGHCAVKVFEL